MVGTGDLAFGRGGRDDGLGRMVVISVAGHAALIAAIALLPAGWFMNEPVEESAPVTISLGGAPGQDTGGLTQMSSRSIQAEAPPEAKPVVTTPPAAKVPEMVAPEPDVKPKPAAKPVQKPDEKSATRKPTVGERVAQGAAPTNTGATPVPFGGFSTSGSDSTGGPKFDVANFCCPEYAATMTRLIRSNWNQRQGAIGQTIVKFTIRRDGMLVLVEVTKGSGNQLLDLESRRAVLATKQLPPLPAEFTNPTLTVHLAFDYRR